MERGSESETRKFTHNEIAEICRDEFLRLHEIEDTIYEFADQYKDMPTTEEELRSNFAVDVRRKEGK